MHKYNILHFLYRRYSKSGLGFKSVRDDKKEKEFYDGFIFANEEGFFDEVMEALDDENTMRRGTSGCCVLS